MNEFLKKNRPEAPPAHPREASLIWAKISILDLKKNKAFLMEKGILLGFLTMLILGVALNFSLLTTQDPQIITDLEDSLNMDFDNEELSEVNDLISLVP